MSNDELMELILQYLQRGCEPMECQEGHSDITLRLIDIPPGVAAAIVQMIDEETYGEWKNEQ